MVQIVLIKDANTPAKTVGDVVGFYREEHIFSERELIAYDIFKLEGYTFETINAYKDGLGYQITVAFKSDIADEYTLKRPEILNIWRDKDKKWYDLKEDIKYHWTFRNMTSPQRALLESPMTPSGQRLITLANCFEFTLPMKAENLTEVTELAGLDKTKDM